MAGTRTLLLLAATFALSCSLLAEPAAAGGRKSKVAEVCKSTSFPDLCTKTASKHAKRYPTVDPLTVLQMQVDAFEKRTAAARARVAKKLRKASPTARSALVLCNKLYLDAEDNLGACRRAIGFKDGVTIRATMSMATQDMQNCDEKFRQVGEKKNPLERFNKSLIQMTEICRSLSNNI